MVYVLEYHPPHMVYGTHSYTTYGGTVYVYTAMHNYTINQKLILDTI